MKPKRDLLQICLLVALLLVSTAAVQAQFTFTTNNGAITITGYTGSGGAVSIPSAVGVYPVTTIGTNAFNDSDIISVTIPNGISTIQDDAFAETDLNSVTIPESVTNIAEDAFEDCVLLSAITVGTGNPAYISVGGILYNTNKTTLIQYPPHKSGSSYTIPNGVSRIGDTAFEASDYLTSIAIDTNVTTLGDSAFFSTALSSITIPAGVTNIGGYAFEDCSLLTSIYFNGNALVYGIGYGPYSFETHASTTIYYYAGTSGWSSSLNGDGYSFPTAMLDAPNPNGSLEVNISPTGAVTAGAYWQVDGGIAQPSGATVLGLSVGNHTVSFSAVSSWPTPSNQTVSVSANATSSAIGNYSTEPPLPWTWQTNDGTITITGYIGPAGAVTIPSTINGLPVTAIGTDAFYDYSDVTSVTISGNVTTIDDYAFSLCNNLANVIIGNSVTSIGNNAFYECHLLSAVNIGNSVTNIGAYAFYNCNSLPGVTIPPSVNNLGFSAFLDCYGLTTASISGNNCSIGEGAFEGCIDLTNVYISNGIVTIGVYAFYNCTSLRIVEIAEGLTSIGSDAFAGQYPSDPLNSLVIPNSVTSIGDGAFNNSSLTSVVIPNNVTNIGAYAFSSCQLTNAYFQGNAPTVDGSSGSSDNTVFADNPGGMAYFAPSTTGWGSTFGSWPIALWYQSNPVILNGVNGNTNFGVRNNQFGFTVSWATNLSVVVQAATNLVNPVWISVSTNTLTNGTFYFSDLQWTNFRGRYYRISAP